VGASAQNQAFNALLFFFRHVLERDFELGDTVTRAKRRKYIPQILTQEEIEAIVMEIGYPYSLVTQLLYGCGLRLTEALSLRVQNFDFDQMVLTVRRGKGGKDRTVPIPDSLRDPLQEHLIRVETLYGTDEEHPDFLGSFMPEGSPETWRSRSKQWPWQFFFPARTLTLVPDENGYRRYHLHSTHFGKRLRRTVRKLKFTKRVTAHTFRHSFASHLLLANYDIRTVQVMLGHSDVKTTMIYTQTVPSRTLKEQKSPLDLDIKTRTP
jgi:integron integrase